MQVLQHLQPNLRTASEKFVDPWLAIDQGHGHGLRANQGTRGIPGAPQQRRTDRKPSPCELHQVPGESQEASEPRVVVQIEVQPRRIPTIRRANLGPAACFSHVNRTPENGLQPGKAPVRRADVEEIVVGLLVEAIERFVVVAKGIEADILRPERLPESPGAMPLRELFRGIITADPGAQQRPVHRLAAQEGLMSRQQ